MGYQCIQVGVGSELGRQSGLNLLRFERCKGPRFRGLRREAAP